MVIDDLKKESEEFPGALSRYIRHLYFFNLWKLDSFQSQKILVLLPFSRGIPKWHQLLNLVARLRNAVLGRP